MTTCSDFPSEAMLWSKEEVDSLDELKSSRSVYGKNPTGTEDGHDRGGGDRGPVLPGSRSSSSCTRKPPACKTCTHVSYQQISILTLNFNTFLLGT